ncbi:hypothetical protein GCM10010983_49820 [Caulobacter rhizosphaerae]|nr:hypothetical protein GCM10010983_49820 [Caulobacter rhizosphaerae]
MLTLLAGAATPVRPVASTNANPTEPRAPPPERDALEGSKRKVWVGVPTELSKPVDQTTSLNLSPILNRQ